MFRFVEGWVQSSTVTLIRYNFQTVLFTPILAGGAAAWLLGQSGQLKEIYLALLESPEGHRHAAMGLAAVALLSSLIYVSSYLLGTWRIDSIYPRHARIGLDRWLKRLRDGVAIVAAMLPFAGLLWGLSGTRDRIEAASVHFLKTREGLQVASGVAGLPSTVPAGLGIEPRMLGMAMLAVLAAAVLFGVALVTVRGSRRVRHGIVWASIVVTFLAVGVPFFSSPGLMVDGARLLGPLTTIATLVVALYGALLLFSYFTRVTGVPVIGLLAVAAIVMGMQKLSRTEAAPPVPARDRDLIELFRLSELQAMSASADKLELKSRFARWLESRADIGSFRDSNKPYPVFIFAAQGGGLFAASAIADTLFALQRDCPAFAQHVFAISAVSGGAVGSAMFQTAFASHAQRQPGAAGGTSCGPGVSSPPAPIDRIVLEDHLSPIAGSFLPDLIRKWLPWDPSGDAVTRSRALERSISDAVAASGLISEGKGPCAQDTGLASRFDEHWCERSAAPALVLNATWVENGHRVAFAPFKLEKSGDSTLHSFADLAPHVKVHNVSIIEAVVVSARYPGVLSSQQYRAEFEREGKRIEALWNFVDGGYADASGAQTALEIFEALNQEDWSAIAGENGIDLRLVLVSDSEGDRSLASYSGTAFSDTLAPFSALLNIRALLSSKAVTQAVSRGSVTGPRGGPAAGRVMVIGLDRETFPISIGWRMSRATYNTVRLMLGDQQICSQKARDLLRASPAGGQAVSRATRTVLGNSCVLRTLGDLVRSP